MTWTKLSDDFADDCWTLSDAAFRLHVEGLTWTNRKLTDLRIRKADLPRLAKHPEAVAELLAVGWWSEAGDAYVIRHHACYQRTAADVVHQQEVNRSNRARGRARPVREQHPTQPDESSDESSDASTDERDGTGQDWLTTGTELEVAQAAPAFALTPYLRKWAAARGWPDDGSLDSTLTEWGPLSEAQWCRRLREITESAYEREAG